MKSPPAARGSSSVRTTSPRPRPRPIEARTESRGIARSRSTNATTSVGRIITASSSPPASHDFRHASNLKKNARPTKPKTIDGTPLSACRIDSSQRRVRGAQYICSTMPMPAAIGTEITIDVAMRIIVPAI